MPGLDCVQAKLEVIRQAMWAALPNEDAEGKPFSGSYWCETDYDGNHQPPSRRAPHSLPACCTDAEQ